MTSKSLFENVGQASSLTIHGASLPRVSDVGQASSLSPPQAAPPHADAKIAPPAFATAASWLVVLAMLVGCLPVWAADNVLTESEKKQGFLLLFDGRSTSGWMNSDRTAPRTPVLDGALNPHKAGHYMLVHTQQWSDFLLALDFKITNGCNSGVFIRTASLTPRPGKDVGFNGLEIAIDDTKGAGLHDTGAIYDLVKPVKNAMKPPGEWNHLEVACLSNRVEVVLNGDPVTRADLDLFIEPNKRPDGTTHKFDIAWRDHPKRGYIGLQDHGSPCWFKNIKLRPL